VELLRLILNIMKCVHLHCFQFRKHIVTCVSIAKIRAAKHIFVTIILHEFPRIRARLYKEPWSLSKDSYPCGGGVEYLHRDPASRRRRRRGKSQIWDSKIWIRVLRDSDPKMTAQARASYNCKRHTRPLVREGAPNQQTRYCQTIIKIWS
jgi:hypothetical protein